MKLAITSHLGICFSFFESIKMSTTRQKMIFIKIANCPNTTNEPVINGKGVILSSTFTFLLLISIYLNTINTMKLMLQINVSLENSFMIMRLISQSLNIFHLLNPHQPFNFLKIIKQSNHLTN